MDEQEILAAAIKLTGSMGVVFMAEQIHPVKRRVALKLVKPGMATLEIVARFEAERQALALMDHPNITKSFDCGTTDDGRPYFVMELVKGLSIKDYCDDNNLTPKQRLQLFIPVCQAIQHAHQKGIIHRDLKPSNILVSDYHEQAVPKVIDFGVAKALNQQLTEKTLFTQYGQILGTIEYMSPEQAKVNQLDVDTRSDIFLLGVVLFFNANLAAYWLMVESGSNWAVVHCRVTGRTLAQLSLVRPLLVFGSQRIKERSTRIKRIILHTQTLVTSEIV